MEGSPEHRSKPVPAGLLCPDRLRAVGVCRSGYDRARRRHGPAGLGGLRVDDLHRLHRGTRQHARRFCRGAGLHLVDPPLNYSLRSGWSARLCSRWSPASPSTTASCSLSLYNGLLQVVGTSPETANPSEGGSTLLVALGVALGIAAGATLGTHLGRPIADQLRHIPTRPVDGDPAVAAERL
jgi:hypothetical protein